MRVIHLERTSATGHVVPRCGVWGSTDTGWTEDAVGVTCVACRGAMRDDAPADARQEGRTEDTRTGRRVEEAAASAGPGTPRESAGRVTFALQCLGAALVAWVGAWALPGVSGVLRAGGSGGPGSLLWITVALLVLGGGAFAALAGVELGRAYRGARRVRRHGAR